jgi:hypothetical protein
VLSPLDVLAVGGPNLLTADGWDAAPLLLMALFVVLLRSLGVRSWPRVLLVALIAGLVVDLVTDALRLSFPTTLALIVLACALASLRRVPAR